MVDFFKNKKKISQLEAEIANLKTQVTNDCELINELAKELKDIKETLSNIVDDGGKPYKTPQQIINEYLFGESE